MNGFKFRLVAAALLTVSAASAPATAGELQATVHLTLTVLPDMQTRALARVGPDGHSFVQQGLPTGIDFSNVRLFVRLGGVDQRYRDADLAQQAINVERSSMSGPVDVTLIF